MTDCIFCKIAKGEIPSLKIWEDENFLVIVDAFPILKDQLLLIPKKHIGNYLFSLDNKLYQNLMLRVKKIAKVMDKSLKPIKIGMIVEGLEVNHVHIKLIPLYNKEGFGLKPLNPRPSENDFKELVNKIKRNL